MLLTFVTFGTKTGKFSGLSNISKTFSTGAPTSTDFVMFGIDVPPRDPAASRKVGVSLFGIHPYQEGGIFRFPVPASSTARVPRGPTSVGVPLRPRRLAVNVARENL